MRWIFIAVGLLAAASAIGLIGLCSDRTRKKRTKHSVSIAATVSRILPGGENGPVADFLCRGDVIRFSVPREIARQLRPGERGVLTYRDSSFIYFVPKENFFEEPAEKVLPVVS